jgi:glycerol-3-phosphate dehydrogenase (NAD(P)+)
MAQAIVWIVAAAGAPMALWARRKEQRDELESELSPTHVRIVEAIGDAVEDAELVFIAVPTDALLEVAFAYGEHARGDQLVIHACRGVGDGFLLPHQMIRKRTCVRKIGVLGGPLHANEIGSGRPLAVVVASRFQETIRGVRSIAPEKAVFIHESKDVVGVEVAGALSNVTQIAAGMSDALELGDTARGVLLTRGLIDARRLGVAHGADVATFTGLAGVGDLIPRRVSSTDRHRTLGGRLAKGEEAERAIESLGGHVEGVKTAAEAAREAARLGLDLPLVRAVDQVLSGAKSPRESIESILRQDLELDVRQPISRSSEA